ncbi:MAG: PH domain-containing protein [Segniliparus sp.]|uniref:PH domain-containing protein n=1 Tax=Segniliparus sp. TaxID=2804064 RepID=UPI003F35C71F
MASEEAEDWLASGERVLVEAKPHWKVFAGLLLAGLVLGLVLAALGYWHAGHAEQVARSEHVRANLFAHRVAQHKTHGLSLEILGGVVFLVFLVVGFVRWRAPRYFVTDQRVAVRRGLLVRAGTDVPLGKVNAIRHRQGIFDRLFKTGTVSVSSGGLRAVRLSSIRDPQEAQAKIYEGQRAAAQPVVPRYPSPPPPPGGQFGSGAGGFASPPPAPSAIVPPVPVPAAIPAPSAIAPQARRANDGPPVPPWARDEPDSPGLNL